ncbi:UNKNOWN [Stylonychia lemnae]|uniref:Uncharacterized protein n=1 Tax=Stylonychia lemnae TaxID=5949 RepID=A0A078B7A3_STYLE|nr:UNKNOWN [Stylonychia lemnae]|eukprot:CDW89438.1 UNKNOWN [Stylonychia lemnae]
MVATFANKLHNPKAVPANLVGNIIALIKQQILQAALIPNLASKMEAGIKQPYYLYQNTISIDHQ